MKRNLLAICGLLLAVSVSAGVTTIAASKQPWEQLPGIANFSSVLSSNDNVFSDNCTVSAVDPAGSDVTDNVVSYDNTATDNTVPYTLKGGSDGNTYKVTIRCISARGYRYEQDVIFKVQEF